MHLAAALKVPVVAIFGPTDPARNAPHETKCMVLRNPGSRTSSSHTSVADPGLFNINTDEVFSAARNLLETSDG
jgi:heptosyltransferase-1